MWQGCQDVGGTAKEAERMVQAEDRTLNVPVAIVTGTAPLKVHSAVIEGIGKRRCVELIGVMT